MTSNRNKIQKAVNIEELFKEGTLIDKAINSAVKVAIERHKKLSQAIAIWRHGKVILVDPKNIDEELIKHDK